MEEGNICTTIGFKKLYYVKIGQTAVWVQGKILKNTFFYSAEMLYPKRGIILNL